MTAYPATNAPFMAATVLSSSSSQTANGVATFSLNAVGGDLSYNIIAANTSSLILSAHFHSGAAGVTGGVLNTICSPCTGNSLSGTWSNVSAFSAALAAGAVYINLHTTANPNGELRGQVTIIPLMGGALLTPSEPSTATGVASVSLSGLSLTYSIAMTGLSGAISQAHFHTGAAGTKG
jgi:hypothetical protein